MSTPGRVLIEQNNRFESSGAAILISGDANQWYESGAVTDVTIRRNVFESPCLTSMYQFSEGIISIDPEVPRVDPGQPFHRNIRIEANEFHPFDFPVVREVRTGTGLSNNRMVRSHEFEAFHARKATLTLEACSDVRIVGNRFEGDVLGRNIALKETPAAEVVVGPDQGWIP